MNIPSEIRWDINTQYHVLTADGLRDPTSFDGNEQCACGSSKKFANCHSLRCSDSELASSVEVENVSAGNAGEQAR